ncbi:MAG TPA: transglycosylase domain-containing protein [Acidimicrobiales bacterium]|jgi:penicillin-binding protein 1A|nr:transglycosylase domain-containing protein [Acidimicrobiales bacterium]
MAPPKRTPAHNLKTTRKGKVTKRSFLWRWRRGLFLVGIVAVMGFAGFAWVLSQVKLPPAEPTQAQTSFICFADQPKNCNKDNAAAALHGAINRVKINRLDDVPQVVQHAVLAAEDRNFFKHGGIDPVGIARAAVEDLTSGSRSQGGSTITQQYVRNVYLNQRRTWTRKLKEAVLAVKIEQKLSKKEIFRRYLNTIYFGRGAYGIQAAAGAYYHADLKNLNLAQAAFLAAIIRSPGTDPTVASQRPYAKEIRDSVLTNMRKAHWITQQQETDAKGVPVEAGVIGFKPSNGITWLGGPFGPDAANSSGSQYFVSYVTHQLISIVGEKEAYSGGYRVYTTLDPGLQTKAYDSVVSTLNSSAMFSPKPQAALVSVDSKGHVVAMVSGDRPFGAGAGESQVNLTVGKAGGGGGRQPGSTFKAFALAEAVKQDKSLYSGFTAPAVATYPWYTKDGVHPQPVHSEAGSFNLITGIAHSVNNVYVPLMHDLGPENVAKLAYQLGIDPSNSNLRNSDGSFSPGLVLGTGEVAPIDMATAYNTFANNGRHIDTTVITRIEDANGKVVWKAPDSTDQVLTEQQNAKVVYALQQVLVSGTASGKGLPWQAAGKTGTTDNSADGWFVGFTPSQLTTAVWMGYPESGNKPMPKYVQGGTFPALIWHNFMYSALKDGPHTTFPTATDLSGGEYINPPVTSAAPSTVPSTSSTTAPSTTSSTPASSTSTTNAPSTTSTSTAPPVTHGPSPPGQGGH